MQKPSHLVLKLNLRKKQNQKQSFLMKMKRQGYIA